MVPPLDELVHVRWCPSCLAVYRADFTRCPVDGGLLSLSSSDPLIGTTIGQHYVVDAFLGEGAMARVYRAHHALLEHKQFAVKVLIGDLAARLEMRLRFAQEADAASQLDHPNVVSVVDFGRSESGLMFLVMEFVDGRSLAELITTDGPLKPRRALALARQICVGLGHAHERGLVHRDLKPDNIIIAGRPEMVRIVDFGLAIVADNEQSTRLTGIGLAMGTPIYAAPEQTHAEAVDHRADLFALGVTLYEMLAGKPPFDGGIAELIRQNASDAIPPIASRSGAKVPPAIENVCRRLMRRDPAERFPDATSALAAIDAAQLAPSRIVALPVAPAPRRRGARVVFGVALLAGLATVGGWFAFPEAPAQPSTPRATIARDPVHVDPPPVEPPTSATPPVVETPTDVAMPAPAPTRERAKPTRTPERRAARVAVARAAPIEAPPKAPIAGEPPVEKMTAVDEKPVEEAPIEVPASVEAKATVVDVKPAVAEPAVIEPPVAVAIAKPVVAPKPAVVWTTANVRVDGLRVRGALPDTDVRRGIERVLPASRACYQRVARAESRSPAATVTVTLSIDESRRASNVRANGSSWPALASCVIGTLEALRVQNAPDTGDVAVAIELAFQPVGP